MTNGTAAIQRLLDAHNIVAPGREASLGEREAFIKSLFGLIACNKDEQIAKLLTIELDKARRNLKQKRYRDRSDRHTMTPAFSPREVAILDWIALQFHNEAASAEAGTPQSKTTNASRNDAIRFLINKYAAERMAKALGKKFETTLNNLEQNQGVYQNTWRSRTSMMKSPSKETRLKAPNPPDAGLDNPTGDDQSNK